MGPLVGWHRIFLKGAYEYKMTLITCFLPVRILLHRLHLRVEHARNKFRRLIFRMVFFAPDAIVAICHFTFWGIFVICTSVFVC
jgi:hypothetical protein